MNTISKEIKKFYSVLTTDNSYDESIDEYDDCPSPVETFIDRSLGYIATFGIAAVLILQCIR